MQTSICHGLSDIEHLPRLTIMQLQTLLVIDRHEHATTNTIADILGYDSNEVTKSLMRTRFPQSDRPTLIEGSKMLKGKGNPYIWKLTQAGQNMIAAYKQSLKVV